MSKVLSHVVFGTILTALTQVGGVAWVLALVFRWHKSAFGVLYVVLSASCLFLAPWFGRTPLPCTGDGALVMQSKIYCALNRHYVTPEVAEVLIDLASAMDQQFPGTQTLVLDGNFPFLNGFPLLPHLSHHDGKKADVAFYYSRDGRYLRGQTKSPIGYFAFEQGKSNCPHRWLSLRWDMTWLQPLWPDMALEPNRTKAALAHLAADARVGKVFLEPHLKRSLGLQMRKIRFQGCRAARHDDHIHFQL